MARRQFSSRPVRNETEHSQHPYPSEGDPSKGIPHRQPPLPGEHNYPEHAPTEHQQLDVGPAKPYYDGGNAHGVVSDVHYGGRPSPGHVDRTREAASNPIEHEETEAEPYPIPVYMVDSPSAGVHPIRRTSFQRKQVPPGPPVPLVDQDAKRSRILLLNEGAVSTGNVRLSSLPTDDVLAILPGGMNSYMNLHSQDYIFAQCDSGNSTGSYVSIICEYDR